MPAATFKVKARTSQERAQRIANYAADPKRRAVAARLLNNEAAAVVRIAREIARHEFREDREEKRRPPNRRGKPHYADSFTHGKATVKTLQEMTVAFGTTYEDAHLVERKTREHTIRAKPGGKLVFPFAPPPKSRLAHTPGGPAGGWPPNFGGGRGTGIRSASIDAVNHPGSPAFNVLGRALRRYRDRSRR